MPVSIPIAATPSPSPSLSLFVSSFSTSSAASPTVVSSDSVGAINEFTSVGSDDIPFSRPLFFRLSAVTSCPRGYSASRCAEVHDLVVQVEVESSVDLKLVERRILVALDVLDDTQARRPVTQLTIDDLVISTLFDPTSHIVWPFYTVRSLDVNTADVPFEVSLATRGQIQTHKPPIPVDDQLAGRHEIALSSLVLHEHCTRIKHVEQAQAEGDATTIPPLLNLPLLFNDTWSPLRETSTSSTVCDLLLLGSALSRRLLSSISELGYLRLRVDSPRLNRSAYDGLMGRAQTDALDYFRTFSHPVNEIPPCMAIHNESAKFIGFRANEHRQFLQLRQSNQPFFLPKCSPAQPQDGVMEDEEKASRYAAWIKDFEQSYLLLSDLSRLIVRVIVSDPALGLDRVAVEGMMDQPAKTLWTDPSSTTLTPLTRTVQVGGAQQETPLHYLSSTVNSSLLDFGADVLRIYQYYRPTGTPIPRPHESATTVHADIGVMTVCPLGSAPGLATLSSDGLAWHDAEGRDWQLRQQFPDPDDERRPVYVYGFTGEILSQMLLGTGQTVRRAPPVLHFVYEGEDAADRPRISMPFFLRAKPDANICSAITDHTRHIACTRRLGESQTVIRFVSDVVTVRRMANVEGWHYWTWKRNGRHTHLFKETTDF